MNGKELLKKIDEKNLASLYLMTGPEKFMANQVEKNLIESLIPTGLESLNLTLYTDQVIDVSGMIANCKTLPLMSQRRIIIVRDSVDLTKIKNKKDEEAFIDYLANPNETSLLLIYWEKADKRRKLYKAMAKYGTVLDFQKLNQRDLSRWINERLKEAGKSMTKQVLDLLIDRSMYLINENKTMEIIANEINQLIDHAGERQEISQEDVLLVLPQPIEDGIFKLIDYGMTAKKDQALLMLGQFYLQGESPFGVFSLLMRQIRQLIQVKLYQKKYNNDINQIAKDMKLNAYIVRKILRNAQRYSLEKLWDLMVLGADLDFQMKTGEIDQELGLELFLLKI